MKNQKLKTEAAYFSAEATTRKMAKRLESCLDAELYESRPEQDYTRADLDWNNKLSRSTLEMKDRSNRVKITGELPDLKDIDVLFFGFPIW